jgi:hypothetical protein
MARVNFCNTVEGHLLEDQRQVMQHRRGPHACTALVLLVGLASLACGGSETRPVILSLGFAGATESFVWFEYFHVEAEPLWRAVSPESCEAYEQIGNCHVPRDCPRTTPVPPEELPEPAPPIDPGLITVAGVPLLFEEEPGWSSASFNPLLPKGERISFSVAGSREVPTHDGEFVIPAPVTVTEPDLSSTVVVDRTVSFWVRWAPAEIGEVIVLINDDQDARVGVSCSAQASAGEIEIPAEVLAHLPDEIALEAYPATFSISQFTETFFHPGDWSVRLQTFGPSELSAPADVN